MWGGKGKQCRQVKEGNLGRSRKGMKEGKMCRLVQGKECREVKERNIRKVRERNVGRYKKGMKGSKGTECEEVKERKVVACVVKEIHVGRLRGGQEGMGIRVEGRKGQEGKGTREEGR